MNQRKNAFTLIELLAVIIILAAIALIIAPLVLDIIKEQQMKTFKESINGILRSSRLEIVNSGLKFPATFTYQDGKLLSPTGKELKVTGKIPNGTGSVTYTSEDDITLGITDQTWCGTYNKISKEVEINEFTGECNESGEYNLTTNDPMYECFTFDSSSKTITQYVCENKTVTIPTRIDGIPVEKIGASALAGTPGNWETNYQNIPLIEEVDFSKAKYIVEIGAAAFECNNLRSADLSELINLNKIGENAFEENQLTNVIIPDNVTTIGNYSFCDNQLTSITIPNKVTTIGDYAFDSNGLTSVTIPDNVTTIGFCSFRYNQLTSVTIPNNVTVIGNYAFYYNQLTSITIQGKSSSADFTSYPTSSPFGWAEGYNDSNIIWNG